VTKAERLLFILDLIRRVPNLNARDLCQECGVSERTLYRDLVSISCDLGVSLYYDSGYRLAPRAFLPPLNLTPEEALALKISASATPLARQAPYSDALKRAVAKIESCLTDRCWNATDGVENSFRIDPPARTGEHDAPVLSAVQQAIQTSTRLKIGYSSLSSGDTYATFVDPYALIFRRHNWYLIAHSAAHSEVRTFKVRRIKAAQNTEEAFTRDEGFSIEEYLRDSWELFHGEPVEVKVAFSPKVARLLREQTHHESEKVEEAGDGSVIYTAKVAGVEEFARWVLTFGAEARAISPPELADELRRTASTMAELYAEDGGRAPRHVIAVDSDALEPPRRDKAKHKPAASKTPKKAKRP
jgi:predicted DNA-binding transcriptional regulator YafY